MIEIRFPTSLYEFVVDDLARPHDFALERVGFIFGRFERLTADRSVVVLSSYQPVEDSDYLQDDNYAAAFSSGAIAKAMQVIRAKKTEPGCIFHIHAHGRRGRPSFSYADEQGLPPLIPSFLRSGPNGVHGLILLSEDSGIAQIWKPDAPTQSEMAPILLTGKVLRMWS